MRTLLNEPCPPESTGQSSFSPAAETAPETARTFPLAAVLASKDDLVEVGVDGTIVATPGALLAEEAGDGLERGAVFPQEHGNAEDFSLCLGCVGDSLNQSETV